MKPQGMCRNCIVGPCCSDPCEKRSSQVNEKWGRRTEKGMKWLHARELYNRNKEWLEKEERPERSQDMKFFEEYKKLGGKHSLDIYLKNLDMFFKMTFSEFVNGELRTTPEGLIWDRDLGMSCFWASLGWEDKDEANKYFDSVDNIHSYT